MNVEDRRQAVAELKAEGESTRKIAEVLGVDQATIVRDANASKTASNAVEIDAFASAAPIDAVAALDAPNFARVRNMSLRQALARLPSMKPKKPSTRKTTNVDNVTKASDLLAKLSSR